MSAARIQLLPPLLANQLDAGARRIEIEVEEGGVKLIRVRDDGSGVHRDDLALALSRHATSKILSFDDLVAVRSLGFRGAALPSIASVSQLTLITRNAGSAHGWQVRSRGEQLDEPVPAAPPVGTTVHVRQREKKTPTRRASEG